MTKKVESTMEIIKNVVKNEISKVIEDGNHVYVIFKHGYEDDNMVRIDEDGRAVFCHPFSDAPEEVIC